MHRAFKSICGYLYFRNVLTCMLAGFLLPSAFAAGVFDTSGFENYSPGNLSGQAQTVVPSISRNWTRAGNGGGTAVVGNAVGNGGTKGVQVGRGADSDDRWAVPVGDLGYPSQGHIIVDWDMKVMGTGAPSGIFGPFLGVDTYDDTINPKVLGSLGVDATTGDVLYQQQGTGILLEAGITVSFNTWHHFQIRLDFVQDSYQFYVNGILRGTQNFVDGPSNAFTDADIAAFAAAADAPSQAQTATAFFDNFKVLNYRPGDFDDDGDIDGHDFLIWQRGGSPSPLSATDLAQWQSNYGTPLAASLAAVPEPAVGSLISMALLCMLAQRRVRQNRRELC